MKLKDRVTLVTGGGSGIGRAIAVLFAKEGGRIVVADIDAKGGADTVRSVQTDGGEAVFVQADVSNSAEVKSMIRSAVNTFGGINVLVNNAGVWWPARDRLVTEMAEEDWDRIVAIDLKGVFLCSKYAIPELIRVGGGSVVNVASVAGLVASERPAYAASKGGVIALTRSLAAQFARSNVRVNVVCPGSIDTPLMARGLTELSVAAPQFPLPDGLIERMGTPMEVAQLALYLASDDSSYSTGGVYVVDGGATAR